MQKETTPYIIGSPLTLSQTKGQGEGAWSLTKDLRANYSARMYRSTRSVETM